MTYKLLKDAIGSKGVIYGNTGDLVTLLAIHDNVAIVQHDRSMVRFPVRLEGIEKVGNNNSGEK